MGQHLPDFAEPRWFVCHTKPRCEKKFAALLVREQYAHYLPLLQSVRRAGLEVEEVELNPHSALVVSRATQRHAALACAEQLGPDRLVLPVLD